MKHRPDLWEKEKEIVDLYLNKGKVPNEIGKIFNCNKTTIHTILKSNKIKLDYKRARLAWKDKDKIIDKYVKGFSADKISKEFNCSFYTIYRILKENNIEIKRNKIFWDKQDEIIKKYNGGMSADKIFKVMGCKSRTIIAEILEKNNIKIKPAKYYLKGKIPPNKIDLNPKKLKEIKKLYGKLSTIEIAKKFNYHFNIIYRILRENNIKLEKNGFFQKGKHNSPKTEFKKGQFMGEKHPNWNNGSSFEPYGIEFNKKLKKQIRKRDNFTCQECGIMELKRKLSIHHVDYNKLNNSPWNLISLCLKCHMKTNYNRKHWTNYFKMKIFLKEFFNPQNIKVFNENRKLIVMGNLNGN